jgi:hypothetical protein
MRKCAPVCFRRQKGNITVKKTELTNAELARLDFVHNEIFALISYDKSSD